MLIFIRWNLRFFAKSCCFIHILALFFTYAEKLGLAQGEPLGQKSNQGKASTYLPAQNAPEKLGQKPVQKLAKISGTFIQYQSWMMGLDANQWTLELDAMKSAGMDTLIIQWLKLDHSRFFPIHVHSIDPTEIILSYADKNKIKVYLGIQFDKNWWNSWDDSDFLSRTVKKEKDFSKDLFKRYGSHPSFSGWYIPYELSDNDFDKREVSNLRNFLKELSLDLKSLTPKGHPVLVSTFFEGKIPASAVQEIYSSLLKGSGIDIILVQDGVGAHNWNSNINEKIAPYFEAFKKAAKSHRIRIWSVVESFSTPNEEMKNSTRTPTDIFRLREQLIVQALHPTEKVITFDFFHYMSPYRGELQKKLNQDFIQGVKKLF